MTDAAAPAVTHNVNINLDQLKGVGMLGVNRASAFLGFGLSREGAPPPKSVALTAESNYQFLPDPLPEQLAQEIQAEFNVWLVANALMELDRHFSLYLDDVWRVTEWIKSHPAPHRVGDEKDIGGGTNASNKLKMVLSALEADDDISSHIWSISNARNCLAHALGVVTERHAKTEGKLVLRWSAVQPKIIVGDVVYIIDQPIENPIPTGEGARVYLEMVTRERVWEMGEKVALNPRELHELCFFYVVAIDSVMEALHKKMNALGLLKVVEA